MTGREGAPAGHTRPDEQAVAEAKRWFRDPARPDRIDWIENPPGEVIGWAQKHAATIVRAALAAGPDEPLRAFAAWLVEMDNPEDEIGRERRRTVTLTQTIDRARAALAAARPAAEPVHDNRCEAEYVHEAPGWTECGCARRAAAGPAAEPACRYCGTDCSEGRSWDGDGYACPTCSDRRAAENRAATRPAAEPDESMTDAERAIAPFLAWVENFRKNAPELGQALRQRLDEIRATLPTGRAHQPDGGTGDGTTETRTEYRVTATDHAGLPAESEWKRDRDSIDSWAGLWAAEGWTDLVIETRTVTTSTTRTVTPWEAQR